MWCVWTEKWFAVSKENKKLLKWALIKKIIKTDGTIVNYVIKSIIGFMSKLICLKLLLYTSSLLYYCFPLLIVFKNIFIYIPKTFLQFVYFSIKQTIAPP